jgi:hypothetical protein
MVHMDMSHVRVMVAPRDARQRCCSQTPYEESQFVAMALARPACRRGYVLLRVGSRACRNTMTSTRGRMLIDAVYSYIVQAPRASSSHLTVPLIFLLHGSTS